MNCNVFCVLDEGVPSGHLNSDGVGPLSEEGEGNAAVQGDERLNRTERLIYSSGAYEISSFPVSIRPSQIRVGFTYPRGS